VETKMRSGKSGEKGYELMSEHDNRKTGAKGRRFRTGCGIAEGAASSDSARNSQIGPDTALVL
jgi:hypothetical protein